MSSKNTYTEQKYCVYITYYSGDKLPPNYIGSSSVYKIKNGYLGTVKSKEYKSIWKQELKQNQHLFSIEIISYHDTRPEATYKELQLQKIFNVVKNPVFINMAYASVNGFFGRDVSGKNNPNHNNKWTNQQKSNASKNLKLRYKNTGKTKFLSNDILKKSLQIPVSLIPTYILEGWYIGRKYMNTKKVSLIQRELAIIKNTLRCSCLICREEIPAISLSKHSKSHSTGIEYFGKIFVSYGALHKQTGCTSDLYKKYYLNGIDPRPRIGSNGPHEKNYNILFKL